MRQRVRRAPQIAHKYAVLREHCERLGRPYEEIERSTLQRIDLDAEEPAATVERFGALARGGRAALLFSVRGVNDVAKLERIATEILDPLR